MEDNILKVTVEDGSVVNVNVLDIIDSARFNKTFVIYTVNDDKSNVFASILNEKEDSFSFDTIKEKEELDYINTEIDRVVEEVEGEL